MMRTVDVYLVSGVNITIPDDFDPDNDAHCKSLKQLIQKAFIELLNSTSDFDIEVDEGPEDATVESPVSNEE